MMEVRKLGILRIIPIFIIINSLNFTAHAQYGGGTGEPNDPYLIYTAEQMNAIGINPNDWGKHFKLMSDIDLSAYMGTSFNVIGSMYGSFRGVFDGSGHTISNFSYASTNTDNIGLFRYVTGVIKDFGLIDPNVDGGTGNSVGSIVGKLWNGTVTDCHVEGGSVSGTGAEYAGGVGGLVGENNGTISDCSSASDVVGSTNVGGLVGNNGYFGTITNTHADGNVVGNNNVGGLVGSNGYSRTITNSSAAGNVVGNDNVGGLLGMNSGKVTTCCATGSILGNDNVGGLVGDNSRSVISDCYATGSVSGQAQVGGLVGDNGYSGGTISKCYAIGAVTGTTSVGALVGAGGLAEVTFSFWHIRTRGQAGGAGGTGKTTAEMQDPNTFMQAGWDFADKPDGPHDIWAEPEGGGFPILWWQLSPPPELPGFSGGIGDLDDPYLISTTADLNSIGHNPRLMRAHFRLTNDIDLVGVDFYVIGNEAFPFTGVFDGGGHAISNLSYTFPLNGIAEATGFFLYVDAPSAEIRDLGLIAPNVNAAGGENVGALVGSVIDGTIDNCYVRDGNVLGEKTVGGLVGFNTGTITNCCAEEGSVFATGSEPIDGVGGLVGHNAGTITNCYAGIEVVGDDDVGGLVGWNQYTISNCYAMGSVIASGRYVGGLVGDDLGTIVDCYSTSSVVGTDPVGGLVGGGVGSVHNSFWDVQTSGQSTSAGGKGKTTAQMQTTSTFLGWNGCVDKTVWTIDEGNDYPRLSWENKPGEVLHAPAFSDLLAGIGTDGEPYLIYMAEEFNVIGLFPCEWDKYFKLMADIDLSPYEGAEFNTIGIPNPFTGVFDGNGKKITNLSNTRGLFESVSGAIKNLGLIDCNIGAGRNNSVGLLAGTLQGGTITNCYTEDGSVSGDWGVGGLVGMNYGTIADCYARGGRAIGAGWVGGLVGHNSSIITNCHASDSVLASGTDSWIGSGGLVGKNSWGGEISNCCSSSTVTGTAKLGGLVGENDYGAITNCYATGNIMGTTMLGGLVGQNGWGGEISNCYATGSVSASGAGGWLGSGGLVGDNWDELVAACFWDIQTSGQTISSGGTGKTTAEMQTASTFLDAGWDFVDETANGTEDIWWILEGQDYPRLWWELIPEN